MAIFFLVVVTLLYPLAIWLGAGRIEPRYLAVLLLVAALARLSTLRSDRSARWWLGGALALGALALWGNAMLPLKLYPVLVNATLLALFAYSLIFPPSMAERFARMREPDLPAEAVGYTRAVTRVWCVFFAVNGALALVTALWASPDVWLIYNGLIAYLLMGLLFAGEYFFRRQFKRAHHG